MDVIEKYYKKLENLIQEAKTEGVQIAAYHTTRNNTVVDSGILVGQDIDKCGVSKSISTWKQ